MRKLTAAAQSLWAKKSGKADQLWLPLYIHLADSAALAQKLWNRWLSDGVKWSIASGLTGKGDAEKLFVFLAAAHDIGKATPVFQAKRSLYVNRDLDESVEERLALSGLPMRPLCEFTNASKTPHALASQILLKEAGCETNVAVIIGSHHGKPPSSDMLNQCGVRAYSKNYHLGKEGLAAWNAVQKELISYALDLADLSAIEELPCPNMAAQTLLCGLVIMSDWIASNEWYFPYYRADENPTSDCMYARIQKAWERLNFLSPWSAGNAWMNTNLYLERFGFMPNKMQTAVMQTAANVNTPGILVLEAPMGAGKTEAALAAAEIFAYKTGRTGVFFALPTQATSDGIFPRMLDWIDKLDENVHSIQLAHGKAQFNEDLQALKFLAGSTNVGGDEEDSGAIVNSWFEGQKKALLADFTVGTVDQLLMAALKQKHVMLRHLGLANKIVVIDECHAYDAYMSQYLAMALRWLGAYHVPVIVLSATLPAQKRQMVIEAYLNAGSYPKLTDPVTQWVLCRDYPLITWTDGETVKQRTAPIGNVQHEILLEGLHDSEFIDKLDDLLSDGGCAGVIVNTVKRAQEMAQVLRERFGKETVKLLHSLFLAPDRAIKERELTEELGKPETVRIRPAKRIVVGTQVLEQSLDIDFDILVTDFCPMDLLLQRIGRLHRHERARPKKLSLARCLIMGLEDDGFDAGTMAVYGEYLLMRTRAFLPKRILLPHDIPDLVQDVYDDKKPLSPMPERYWKEKEKWEKVISDKEKRACDFRVTPPWTDRRANLVDWLNTDVPNTEKHGEAAVRDSDGSIEVLLIQEEKGKLHFLPWVEAGRELPTGKTPDNELAKLLARQKIRLPSVLCTPWTIDRTIEELECLNSERISQWQQSPWLKGELFLILDENGMANLCGYRLVYNREDGLLYEKEDDADG